jgi:hypothetical protein
VSPSTCRPTSKLRGSPASWSLPRRSAAAGQIPTTLMTSRDNAGREACEADAEPKRVGDVEDQEGHEVGDERPEACLRTGRAAVRGLFAPMWAAVPEWRLPVRMDTVRSAAADIAASASEEARRPAWPVRPDRLPRGPRRRSGPGPRRRWHLLGLAGACPSLSVPWTRPPSSSRDPVARDRGGSPGSRRTRGQAWVDQEGDRLVARRAAAAPSWGGDAHGRRSGNTPSTAVPPVWNPKPKRTRPPSKAAIAFQRT